MTHLKVRFTLWQHELSHQNLDVHRQSLQWAIITRKGNHLKVKQCLPLSKIVGDDATSPTAGGAVGVISTAGLTNELINHECFLSETQKNADKDLSRRHVLSCRKINELLGRPCFL